MIFTSSNFISPNLRSIAVQTVEDIITFGRQDVTFMTPYLFVVLCRFRCLIFCTLDIL